MNFSVLIVLIASCLSPFVCYLFGLTDIISFGFRKCAYLLVNHLYIIFFFPSFYGHTWNQVFCRLLYFLTSPSPKPWNSPITESIQKIGKKGRIVLGSFYKPSLHVHGSLMAKCGHALSLQNVRQVRKSGPACAQQALSKRGL